MIQQGHDPKHTQSKKEEVEGFRLSLMESLGRNHSFSDVSETQA